MANEMRTTDFGEKNGGGYTPPSKNNATGTKGDSGSASSAGLSTLKEQAVDQGQALLSQTKQVAGQAFDSAKGQFKEQLSARKDVAANGMESAVRALEATGQQFRDQDLAFVAGYADNLTNQVRQVSDYLQNKDIDDLTQDVESFARRNPAVFIGGAFLLGLAVARFLKSSNAPVDGSYGAMNNSRALVPVNTGDNRPVPLSDTRNFTSGERLGPDTFGDRPVTAHGYVPGVGVTGTNSAP